MDIDPSEVSLVAVVSSLMVSPDIWYVSRGGGVWLGARSTVLSLDSPEWFSSLVTVLVILPFFLRARR